MTGNCTELFGQQSSDCVQMCRKQKEQIGDFLWVTLYPNSNVLMLHGSNPNSMPN